MPSHIWDFWLAAFGHCSNSVEMSPENPKQSRWPIAVTVLGLALIASLTWLVRAGCKKQSDTTINVTTFIQTTADQVRKTGKLVVLVADVNVEILKKSEKVKKVFGYDIPLGTTEVRLKALGNKVQFVVSLDQVGPGNFAFNGDNRRLRVTIPRPLVDEALVEVQSDPSKIHIETEVGWARLDSRSGQFLRDQAKAELKPAIITEARRGPYADQAEASAKENILKLLLPLKQHLPPDVRFEIGFE